MNDERFAEKTIQLIQTKKSTFWEAERNRHALSLFHDAARRVPAYKDFLKKNKITPGKIKTIKDFAVVPWVNKSNYLRQYPLEKLMWDGTLKNGKLVFTATSGSTGKPFYFPRDEMVDWQSSIYHELFLKNNDIGKRQSTLVIIGFGMGVWIGGLITYQAFKFISRRSYPVTLLTPGANRKEIIEALKAIGGKFDQVVLCGYPPFLKDVIDEATAEGIPLKNMNIKIVFAAEAFSEKFREYIAAAVGIKNIYRNMMNIYGSADLGTMAEETPLSILIRRTALEDPSLYRSLFAGAELLPTLAQFHPGFVNFEAVDGNILCTAHNPTPLIRYEIGDHGGVLTFREVATLFNGAKHVHALARRFRLEDTVSELPFVYVYERSDFSTKLFGAIIYPEHLKEALLRDHLKRELTGKFKMITKVDGRYNEYLEVNVELKPRKRANASLGRRVTAAIVQNLIQKNAEYKYLYGLMSHAVTPRVVFWGYGNPRHFQPGIKQKWAENKK